jgi:hypothetical protein
MTPGSTDNFRPAVVHSPARRSTAAVRVDAVPSRAVVQQRQPRGADLLAVPDFLAGVAAAQSGVVTRRQLGIAGVGEARIRTAVANRRWRTFGRTVVVLHNGPLSERQQRWVAVLLPHKPAALAGLTALTSAGLQGFEPDQVHVVVEHDTQTRVPSWVKLHESRRFRPGDIVRASAPPRTSTTRAAVDAATWSARPRRACAILCAVVQQRLTMAERLVAELAVAGPIRHVAIMRATLGDIGGGGHTLAEIDLGPLAARAGLPAPNRQAVRPEPDGRVRYLDAEFALPDGSVLAVEIDGAVHLQPESWWNDTKRQNEVTIGGRSMLRFPSLTVRLEPMAVVDQLLRMRLAHTPCP